MSVETLVPYIHKLHNQAKDFRLGVRKDQVLYKLLGECLTVCESIESVIELEAVKEKYLATYEAGQRAYIERSSDVYVVIGRIVFQGATRSTGYWRYTATLREAAKRQIRGSDLAKWLNKNGGVNALFMGRPKELRTRTRKVLNLTKPVTFDENKDLEIVVRFNREGNFDVVSQRII